MATAERDIVKLKMDSPSPKGKQEMLRPKSNTNQTDLEKAESRDHTDAMPSNKPSATVSSEPQTTLDPLPQQPCDEEVSTSLLGTRPSSVPSPGAKCEDGARQGVERNAVEQTAESEDNTDAVPSNKPSATVSSEPQTTLDPLPQQPCDEEVSTSLGTSPSSIPSPGAKCEDGARQGVERNDVEQTADSGDNTDAMPSNKPSATVSSEPQTTLDPLPQQPCDEEFSTSHGTRPSSVPSPGAKCKDGARQGVERNAVEKIKNLEDEKDLILHEIAEQVAGSCDLRNMALRLGLKESLVARIEHENKTLLSQFYNVFQLFNKKTQNPEMFKQLLNILVKTDQESAATWLRKRLGIKDPEASLEGGESSPIPDVVPRTETTGGNSDDGFHDIFLVHSGRTVYTKKFQKICEQHQWTVRSIIPVGTPIHQEIERMLNSSTHLALIITESDCIKYKNKELSMTVEMALQLAYNQGELAGKILPIRCCNKKSLPLVLQALTGAHIDEESFEERLVQTIDTKTRISRMREKQN